MMVLSWNQFYSRTRQKLLIFEICSPIRDAARSIFGVNTTRTVIGDPVVLDSNFHLVLASRWFKVHDGIGSQGNSSSPALVVTPDVVSQPSLSLSALIAMSVTDYYRAINIHWARMHSFLLGRRSRDRRCRNRQIIVVQRDIPTICRDGLHLRLGRER